ncbi:MAG: DUF6537 domain-containing protein, partial [Rudaea sp.]
ALMRAIELNGAAIEMNKTAFNWGRMGAVDIGKVKDAARGGSGIAIRTIAAGPLEDARLSGTLDDAIARRVAFLGAYQDAPYAARYEALVAKVRAAEQLKVPGSTALVEAVSRYAFKLMAYKDEYEVARLYTSGEFEKQIRDTFDGDYKIHFNLAPPTFAKKDADGHLVKREFGPWTLRAFRLLAKLKGLRGGTFDPFGRTVERRMERQLVADYFAHIDTLLAQLTRDNLALAVEIASIPEQIRGYGHIKEANMAKAATLRETLLAAWRDPQPAKAVA